MKLENLDHFNFYHFSRGRIAFVINEVKKASIRPRSSIVQKQDENRNDQGGNSGSHAGTKPVNQETGSVLSRLKGQLTRR